MVQEHPVLADAGRFIHILTEQVQLACAGRHIRTRQALHGIKTHLHTGSIAQNIRGVHINHHPNLMLLVRGAITALPSIDKNALLVHIIIMEAIIMVQTKKLAERAA